MISRSIRTLASAAALAVISAVPLAAGARTVTNAPPQTYRLNAVTTRQFEAGEYDGILRITVTAEGLVFGTYRSIDQGLPQEVTGGLQPDGRLWLDIGRDGDYRLTGTFQNGVLHATAWSTSLDTIHFDATPAT